MWRHEPCSSNVVLLFRILCSNVVYLKNTMAFKRSSKNSSGDESLAKKGFWATGLLDAMKNPESIVEEDDLIVVIKDKYPKAEYHFLVLPKEEISNITKLMKKHIPLLKHMERIGFKISEQYPHHNFRIGYHAVASMFRLHLHVISDDFNSPALKSKKHWNSFTTDFFIPSGNLIADLEKSGSVKQITSKRAKDLMDTPLKCHKCAEKPSNIPKLKQHLLSHIKEK